MGARGHGQVGPSPGRAKIAHRRAPAPSAPCRGLIKSGTFLLRAVEIGIAGNAGLHAGLDECLRQLSAARLIRNAQRPAGAVEGVGSTLLVLGLLEIGQDRLPAPTLAIALAPFVIVRRRAAHVDHAVQRAGAAQHLAARLIRCPVVELRRPARFRTSSCSPDWRRACDSRAGRGSMDSDRAPPPRGAERDGGRTSLRREARTQPAEPAPVTM